MLKQITKVPLNHLNFYMHKLNFSLPMLLFGYLSFSQDDTSHISNQFTLRVQETTVSQYRPKFKAAYTGAYSQLPENESGTTITSTIFAGVSLSQFF